VQSVLSKTLDSMSFGTQLQGPHTLINECNSQSILSIVDKDFKKHLISG